MATPQPFRGPERTATPGTPSGTPFTSERPSNSSLLDLSYFQVPRDLIGGDGSDEYIWQNYSDAAAATGSPLYSHISVPQGANLGALSRARGCLCAPVF